MKHLWKNQTENVHSFLVWVNNIEQQKLPLLLLLNPIPFNGQDYEKQK